MALRVSKLCHGCERQKLFADFAHKTVAADGLQHRCRRCYSVTYNDANSRRLIADERHERIAERPYLEDHHDRDSDARAALAALTE